jgi:hypothetical protein
LMCLQKYAKNKIVVVGSLVGSIVTICGIAVAVNQALVVPPRDGMEMKLDYLSLEVLNNRGAMEVEVDLLMHIILENCIVSQLLRHLTMHLLNSGL